MSDLLLVHRPFSKEAGDSLSLENQSFLVWKTCLRQIFFFDRNDPPDFSYQKGDEIFTGLDAETFLAEILCGLKSPLIGETEVFGQFKLWWKEVPAESDWKQRHQGRIEALFSLVKSVREKVLCGQGSQSYGSLLRRFLKDPKSVDVLGAGHLVQEMIPWIKTKSSIRIWCRDPHKVASSELGQEAETVLPLSEPMHLSPVVIVAAPLPHQELNQWLQVRGFSKDHSLFDFRADSSEFQPFVSPEVHLKLGDFFSQYEQHRSGIEQKAQNAREMIFNWKEKQESKVQVRPYGWDDL